MEDLYVDLNDRFKLYFHDSWKTDDGTLLVSMKLEHSDISRLAQINSKEAKLLPNPFNLNIHSLTKKYIEFASAPIYFHAAEIYLLRKSEVGRQQYKMIPLKVYRIKVISTPNITCKCSSNFIRMNYFCRCTIFSRPIANVSIQSPNHIDHTLNVETQINQFDYHKTTANITFNNIRQDTEINICLKDEYMFENRPCYKFKAQRFPRRISDLLIVYFLLPILMLTVLPILVFLILSCVKWRKTKNKSNRCVITEETDDYQALLSDEDSKISKDTRSLAKLNKHDRVCISSLLNDNVSEEAIKNTIYMTAQI
ncbi:hypothetical protein RF11_10218 [Thelohanellus kitauei]|uniref:Uncharacterized protein n=1 Tax=Thelohanellus kitauei TaxID=669202 RepID=A0A0C2MR06_THEKT|nr:hypothetical protein RF11_10218 [Thelohanellus kitauei]